MKKQSFMKFSAVALSCLLISTGCGQVSPAPGEEAALQEMQQLFAPERPGVAKEKATIGKMIQASTNGWVKVVELGLKQGVDPNARWDNGTGLTFLAAAAAFGRVQVVQLLLDRGADVNAKLNTGATALGWARELKQDAVFKLLLKNGADTGPLDIVDLLQASKMGNAQSVKQLLGKGVNPNATLTEGGPTALLVAVQSEQVDVVRALLNAGADPTKPGSVNGKFMETPQVIVWAHLAEKESYAIPGESERRHKIPDKSEVRAINEIKALLEESEKTWKSKTTNSPAKK